MAATQTQTDYEAVIGLEVHAQVLTRSKMFCGCESGYQTAAPNTRVCPVCMALPGVLPVINKAAVEATMIARMGITSLSAGLDSGDLVSGDRAPGDQVIRQFVGGQWRG